MRVTNHLLVAASSGLLWASFASATVVMNWATVGNPGNAGDSGGPDGAVNRIYQISKYEVTNDQYAEFLNAKASTDPLGLFNTSMGIDARGGIIRSGVSGSYTYSTKTNMANKPVNYVSWYDSIRFANWMNNGQGAGDTETGAYTLLGGTATPSNGLTITRNLAVSIFLASDNEWYKAAYYRGDTGEYWNSPCSLFGTVTAATAIDLAGPTRGDIGNPGFNVGNYDHNADWNGLDGNVTTVGSAGLSSQSFYGTFDQAGNANEWTEGLTSGSFRNARGGSWFGASFEVYKGAYNSYFPTLENNYIGFRVATPEPGSGVTILTLAGLTLARKRRRR